MNKRMKDVILLLSLGCILLFIFMDECGWVEIPEWLEYFLCFAVCLWLIPAYRHWKHAFDVFEQHTDDDEEDEE